MITDRDIPGWFSEVNRNHLIKLIHDYRVKSVLEIGSFLGKSTVFFASRVATVYCIDPFRVTRKMAQEEIHELEVHGVPSEWFAIFQDNIRQSGNIRKVSALLCESGGPLPASWPQIFDLVYIDGDHSYESVRRDIEVYSPHARIVCGDDYGVADGVTQAVDEAWTNPPASKAGPFWWVER